MKIQTGFDKTLKEVYHMLALPYPPSSIKNEEQPEIEDEDEVELEETAILVKPFKPKFKSYNINKDSLTSHRAAKQLTGLISELERKRRENESNKEVHNNTNYLEYKENVVNLINHLSSRAKVKPAYFLLSLTRTGNFECDYYCLHYGFHVVIILIKTH